MRIQFTRTGGFAGIRLGGTVDTSSLDPGEVQALQQELENAQFFQLPTQVSAGTGGPERDRFQYEITVEDGGQKHTVMVGESAIPANLQPLIQHLQQLVRTSRG